MPLDDLQIILLRAFITSDINLQILNPPLILNSIIDIHQLVYLIAPGLHLPKERNQILGVVPHGSGVMVQKLRVCKPYLGFIWFGIDVGVGGEVDEAFVPELLVL